MAARRKQSYGGWAFEKKRPRETAEKMVTVELGFVNVLLAKEAFAAAAAELNSLDRATSSGRDARVELVLDLENGRMRLTKKSRKT